MSFPGTVVVVVSSGTDARDERKRETAKEHEPPMMMVMKTTGYDVLPIMTCYSAPCPPPPAAPVVFRTKSPYHDHLPLLLTSRVPAD